MKGHIRKRGERSWAVVIDLGRDETGRRRQKWISVKGTKRDAEKKLAELLHAVQVGAFVEPSKITLAEYLENWLDAYARTNVSRRTYERYAEIIRAHLIPALGRYPLAKLQPLHIQSYYTQALESGRRDGKGGLSAQTVLHHHRVLREALAQAVKWQLLVRNPADAVDPPRPERREMQVLDEEQTAGLLEAARGTALYIPVLLALTTGMRRGEILGLRWEDIDFDAGTLSVRRSLEKSKDGLVFKEPKTAKSRRVIVLPELTLQELRQHKIEQAKLRLMLGPAYQDNGLVCPRLDGAPLVPDSLTKGFAKLLKRAGLPPIRFHDCRHTHATQLLRAGVHPKIVSERLGHSTTGITLDTYSHVLPDMQKEAARRIDATLRAALKKQG